MKSIYYIITKHLVLQALAIGGALGLFSACEKFVQIDPPRDQLIRSEVFADDDAAISALRGIYNRMSNGPGFTDGGMFSVTALCGLSSDEFLFHSGDIERGSFYTNRFDPENSTLKSYLWDTPYRYIYYANAVLEGAPASTGLSPSVRELLEGEARFIRALCYFYLANLYGEVPLVLGTDYRINSRLPKSSQTDIFTQVIDDLMQAYNLLPTDYSGSAGERVRPIKWTAAALLARTHLYLEEWAEAETYATAVIENTGLYGLEEDLDQVFLKNSREAIWQLMPVLATRNTAEAQLFVLNAQPTYLSLDPDLLAEYEAGDSRKSHWIGSIAIGPETYYFPFKYKITVGAPQEEYASVFRLAEQYLIRAEAYTQLQEFDKAREDINRIRLRADLGATDEHTKEALLTRIEKERRLELFAEWGHRSFDLKRTGKIDGVMSKKRTEWRTGIEFYPIPHAETLNNPELTQNPDYL